MIKAIKLRIFPNDTQRILIHDTIGCSRFIFNQMLAERKEVYEQLKDDKEALYDYKYKTEANYKKEYPFLKKADSIALQASREHLEEAYNNFFNGSGFPNFKSKKTRESYTTKMTNGNIKIDFQRKMIKLPKLKWIRYEDDRVFTQEIKHATVSKTKTGIYFVSLTLEAQDDVDLLVQIYLSKISAFDMSAKDFLVNALIKMENPRFYRKEEKKIAKAQRVLSRKQEGSKNYEKTRLRVAKLHEKVYNRKKDWTHELTRKLADEYEAIILEDLNIKGMQQFNSGLSKSVTLDFSWHQFTTYLAYKMEWNGHHLVKVSRKFPSSQLCSACGEKTNHLTLDMREWTCSHCGTHHDRDVNASLNLLKEGLRILTEERHVMVIFDKNDLTKQTTDGTAGSHAFGEDVRPISILSNLYRQTSMNKERIQSL
ncbi:MAG: RNA-guided endonuclease TnpB family protein [Promethearchaeota archaeon]